MKCFFNALQNVVSLNSIHGNRKYHREVWLLYRPLQHESNRTFRASSSGLDGEQVVQDIEVLRTYEKEVDERNSLLSAKNIADCSEKILADDLLKWK